MIISNPIGAVFTTHICGVREMSTAPRVRIHASPGIRQAACDAVMRYQGEAECLTERIYAAPGKWQLISAAHKCVTRKMTGENRDAYMRHQASMS